jgi:NADH dehydrogenase [ubiquinone] 1 alpha subcomplex assembly factor 7
MQQTSQHHSTPIDTPLARRLAEHIRQHGPMPVHAFMDACLNDPEFGYYRQQQPLGAQGDFTTAPEISQMFGEIVGAWTGFVGQALVAAGEPKIPLNLIELGPGRAVLMADILRVLKPIPELQGRLTLHLIEQNETLRTIQAQTLEDCGLAPEFHADLGSVMHNPGIIIANEFFDCLPVAQSIWADGTWRARCVTLKDGQFIFETGQESPPELVQMPDSPPQDGEVLEFCPSLAVSVNAVASHLRAAPGLALIIDYGATKTDYGDSLQAVRAHDRVSPLSRPGETDLTAHVNFAEIASLARHAGLTVYGPMPQARFLTELGLVQRLAKLVATADAATRNQLEMQAARLVAPGGMGDVFKIMVLASPQIGPPPPFTTPHKPIASNTTSSRMPPDDALPFHRSGPQGLRACSTGSSPARAASQPGSTTPSMPVRAAGMMHRHVAENRARIAAALGAGSR